QADHLLMLLICKRGLVPDLLNSDDWKAFVRHVNPNLKPTPSSEFTTRIIPTEAAKVKLRTESALQKAGLSTLTFDGTQTRKDSFYTLHATTPKDEVFFLGRHFGTKTSHTAEWVKDGALRVTKAVGEDKWAAAVSDSTNTTLAARREITKAIPTVINLCDVVHYLQHVIGDITELPEFVVMLSNMKPVIRHFNKSGKSKASLKDAGTGQGENGTDVHIHALASIGKTCFATHFMAVDTIEPALNPIRELVVQGVVKFKDPDLQELFEDLYSSAFLEFVKDLLRYKIIVRPLAQALWSLEATTANPSDAMVFWLAAAHALDSVFAQDPAKTHISAALAGHIRAAFNGRYHQFFSHSDIYFVAFCLDPRYPIGDYLRERVVPAPEAPTHIRFSHAFLHVKAFIKTLLKGLIDQHQKHDSGCNCHPIFKRKTSLEIVRECQAQLEACWQGEAPFHAPILNDDAMEWWENLEIGYSPRSGVLAMLAVRIFGILANSMPDERTNSNITWFNSPLRGNQKAENLLDMILVGQWHTYHAEVRRLIFTFLTQVQLFITGCKSAASSPESNRGFPTPKPRALGEVETQSRRPFQQRQLFAEHRARPFFCFCFELFLIVLQRSPVVGSVVTWFNGAPFFCGQA
ncbi:ribonuclease H-like domain-containing protein, partial [Mycena vulgaris]